jgi:hypothetical protein
MSRSSCRSSAVVGLACMALAATCATAFVTPGPAITRKQWTNPASQLYMAADKDETTATETKSKSQYFFANQASDTNGKTNGESGSAFDPFQVSSDGNQLESVNLDGAGELKEEEDKLKFGIWAARGILLLVAAIWGTNFAVRAFILRSFFVSDEPAQD